MGEGKNLVGVDIGTSAIKVCQLKETRKGLMLQKLGVAPLPPQTIVDGQVMDASSVVEGIQRVFHDSKIRQKECAISVSGQSVIIRKITVPMMTPAELDEQIHWEAEQHIPFDIKDVQVDYQVLRKRAEVSQMDLLLVAAKRDQISDYAQLARDARLKPIVCDIDAFTVQNLFEFSRGLPPDQTIALINVGASLTSLNIIAGGVSAFTREIANGGASCLPAWATPLGGEVLQLMADRIVMLPDAAPDGVSLGDRVALLDASSISPSEAWIGRVVDPFGQSLDGQPLLRGEEARALRADPPAPATRHPMGARLETGMAIFNTMLPIVEGQRVGLFAGSGCRQDQPSGPSRPQHAGRCGRHRDGWRARARAARFRRQRARQKGYGPRGRGRRHIRPIAPHPPPLCLVRHGRGRVFSRPGSACAVPVRLDHPFCRGASRGCRRCRGIAIPARLSPVDRPHHHVALRTGRTWQRIFRHDHRHLVGAGGGLRHGGTGGRYPARRAGWPCRARPQDRRTRPLPGHRPVALGLAVAARCRQPRRRTRPFPRPAVCWGPMPSPR